MWQYYVDDDLMRGGGLSGAGASLSSLYTSTNNLPVYQVAVDLSSVVFNVVVTGGLPVSVYSMLQQCGARMCGHVRSVRTAKTRAGNGDILTPCAAPITAAGQTSSDHRPGTDHIEANHFTGSIK